MYIGMQLFSVRDKCTTPAGLIQTLEQLEEIGYDGVEFSDYAGLEAETLRAELDRIGIQAINAHIFFKKWFDDYEAEIAYAVKLGLPYVTFPWLPPELRTAETFGRIIDSLSAWTDACRRCGIQMTYHNHDFEYAELHGRQILEEILGADPRVMLELDSFWSYFAKNDPNREQEKYAGRQKLIHIKDYRQLTQPLRFCTIGMGVMDNRRIIQTAKKLGIDWVIVDQDNSEIDTMEAAGISLENIKKIL